MDDMNKRGAADRRKVAAGRDYEVQYLARQPVRGAGGSADRAARE